MKMEKKTLLDHLYFIQVSTAGGHWCVLFSIFPHFMGLGAFLSVVINIGMRNASSSVVSLTFLDISLLV